MILIFYFFVCFFKRELFWVIWMETMKNYFTGLRNSVTGLAAAVVLSTCGYSLQNNKDLWMDECNSQANAESSLCEVQTLAQMVNCDSEFKSYIDNITHNDGFIDKGTLAGEIKDWDACNQTATNFYRNCVEHATDQYLNCL